jgi:aminopeptidase N
MEKTQDRLLAYFVPVNYNLSLTLQRPERLFKGVVTVTGDLQNNSEHIILHSKDLGIKSVVVDGKEAEFAASDNDELFISHPDLKPGRHTIVITYDAKITDAMHGMYPCYFEHEGIKKELLATQFESHHAREVFPCIDEPAAKATFDVTLTTETNITVLSNMPIKLQREESENLVTTFETTPIMSTYLLAWVTGELHKKSGHTKRGVEVNVWSTPAQPLSSLDFSLDIAIRSIDFY